MTTRQQRRAEARKGAAPHRPKAVFLSAILGMILVGGVAVGLLRANPPALTRGALAGDHWHAVYRIEICGAPLEPFGFNEGEIHTHGDGRMHIHPQTAPYTADNANLGAFFNSVEVLIGREDGKDFMVMPDGTRYEDGGTCPGSKEKQQLRFFNKDKLIDSDPHLFIPHEGDVVVARFGPKPKTGENAPTPIPNPYNPPQGAAGLPPQGIPPQGIPEQGQSGDGQGQVNVDPGPQGEPAP